MAICKCTDTVRSSWEVREEGGISYCGFCDKEIALGSSGTLMESYGDGSAAVAAKPKAPKKNPAAPATMDDLLAAQNRTTHAVRAFVRFLFIQLSAITAGAVLLNFANEASMTYECVEYDNCGGSTALALFGVLVIVGGVIASSVIGWSELHKSDMPD